MEKLNIEKKRISDNMVEKTELLNNNKHIIDEKTKLINSNSEIIKENLNISEISTIHLNINLKEIKELKEEIKPLNEKIQELTEYLGNIEKLNELHINQKPTIKDRVFGSSKTKSYNDEIENLESRQKILWQKLPETINTSQKIDEIVNNLSSILKTYTESMERVETRLALLNNNNIELNNNLEKINQDLTPLVNENEKIEQDNKKLQLENIETQQSIEQIKTQLSNLETEISQLKNKLGDP